MKKRTIVIVILLVLAAAFIMARKPYGAQTTCPQDGGWTKIDSNNMSLYPVAGATQYCFKAGSDNSQGCNGGIFNSWPLPAGACGLSHWAYFIPQTTPTVVPTTIPTITITQPTITVTPSPTGIVPSVTPTNVPVTQQEKDETPGPQSQGTNQIQGRGEPEKGIAK